MQARARVTRTFILSLAVGALLWSAPASAGTQTLTLVRNSLTNVDDAAGRWQHEGGEILRSGIVVGQYAIHRRVTFGGTDVQNTAMVTITLFFNNTGAPPQNITLQGAHSYSTGRFVGSVSAASNRYAWIKGADASVGTTAVPGTWSIVLSWTGANQLVLP